MKKKVCSKCKIFVEGSECPLCKGNQFVSNWKGRIYVFDPKRSLIARKINIPIKGEYAIKV